MRPRNEVAAERKLSFRVTPDEEEAIRRRAEKSGETVANYCRKKALTRSGAR